MKKHLYEIKILGDFSAAHHLGNSVESAENLHGHNWKVEVVLRGIALNDSGMLVDFGEVKQLTRKFLAELDHHYLNEIPFFMSNNPSSENIARYLFERLAEEFDNERLWLYRVSAWESADACATYLRE